MANDLKIRKESTALVVIDLQKGIVRREAQPYPAQVVVEKAAELVKAFRKHSIPIFFVHVDFSGGLPIQVESDAVLPHSKPADDWSEFVPEMGVTENDLVVTKRQWGAFYGTDLEQQLRRRKIDTIVLCGIATNYGVQSTARFAYEFGFNQIFVEDATTDLSEEAHRVAFQYMFKRMGRVRSTKEVLEAL